MEADFANRWQSEHKESEKAVELDRVLKHVDNTFEITRQNRNDRDDVLIQTSILASFTDHLGPIVGQSSKGTTESDDDARVIEVNLDYSSWYWVYSPDKARKLQFAVHKGLLIRVGEHKQCVGVDLTDRNAAQWVSQASEAKRARVSTAKLGTQGDLECLGRLPNLESLETSGLSRDELEWICQLGCPLRNLHLSWCPDLSSISPISQCPSLLRLHLSDCPELREVSVIKDLENLRTLEIVNCDEIWEVDEIANAKKLRRIVFRNCENIYQLNPLAVLPDLRLLDLSRSTHVADLAPLEKLNTLLSLDLSNCVRVRDVSPLEGLDSLQVLRLFGCNGLTNLRPLYQLENLKKLSLPNNIEDSDLLGMCIGFSGLIQLDLRNCSTVTDISPMARLKSLRELSLAGCREITDLSPLKELKRLTQLDLACCTKISDLSPLHSLERLKDLYIDGCYNIDDDDIRAFREAMPDCTVHQG
ncbi:MAG: leucine-rich repeat domain-containing protein [Planctomycetota bacterium]